MLKIALDREHITKQEFDILTYIVKKDDMCMKAEELDKFGIRKSKEKSNIMTKLKDKKMVRSITDGGRIYTIYFVNNYLLRSIMHVLKDSGFVSDFLNNNI